MPHAKAFLFNLPTEMIVVSCAIGQGQLLRLLSREAVECLAPEAIHFSYLRQWVLISWAIHPLSLGPSPSIRFLSPEGRLKD